MNMAFYKEKLMALTVSVDTRQTLFSWWGAGIHTAMDLVYIEHLSRQPYVSDVLGVVN